MKIKNDKYYTSVELAKYVVDKAKEIIGADNISEYIEPSAGGGVFLPYLKDKQFLAYDIEPEAENIIKQDYLLLDLEYKKGRCIIGNPPFGNRNNLSVKFFKKSIKIGDYIVFILPISQYNNNFYFYEFDLIYSEDLDIREYSDRDIHCCLNIYKRPTNNIMNKKVYDKLEDITTIKYDRNKTKSKNIEILKNIYDDEKMICIKYFGDPIGKVCTPFQYCGTKTIIVNNLELKDEIFYQIRNANWYEWKKMKCGVLRSINKNDIIKFLKEKIPDIK